MSAISPLTEIVLFEIPARSGASELVEVLSKSRLAWMEGNEEIAVVAVLLNPVQGDLGRLLRTVETFIVQRGLLALSFEVDGRTYLLQPARAGVRGGVMPQLDELAPQ
jgi:hypothetical protein